MERVTGIGGVFFKSEDPDKLKDWYRDHLGLKTTQYGATFYWHPLDNMEHKARTEWSLFKKDTDYFEPSKKEFMMNYRVHDLEKLLEVLKEEGVTLAGDMQTFEYGKFAWIVDPEGNKIELWEPVDEVLNKFDEDNK